MNFKRAIALSLAFIMLMSVTVIASDFPTLDASADTTGKVIIEGISNQFAGTSIFVSVWYPGYGFADAADSPQSQICAYADMVKVVTPDPVTGADFSLTFILPENASSGLYTATAGIPGDVPVVSCEFEYNNVAHANTLIDIIKNPANDGGIIKPELNKLNAISIGLSTKYKGYTYEKQRTYAAESLAALNPRPQNIDELVKALNVIFGRIDKTNELAASDAIATKNIINGEYESVMPPSTNTESAFFGIRKAVFDSYGLLSERTKNLVIVELNRRMASLVLPTDVSKAFEEAIDLVVKNQTTPNPDTGHNDGGNTSGNGKGGSTSISVGSGMISQPKPTETEIPDDVFMDIENVGWAKNAITILSEKGIINGRSETEFCPNESVKREEMVKLLTVGFGLDPLEKRTLPFDDVAYGDWFYEYLVEAYGARIVNGVSETHFGTGESITRQDLAVMIYNTLTHRSMSIKSKDIGSKTGFSDADQIAGYAVRAVEDLASAGIINGMDDGTFAPNAPATRAEVAVILHRVLYKFNLI